MTTDKQRFGQLSREDLKLVLSLLPMLDQQRQGLQKDIADKPEKLGSLITSGFAWAHLYEAPFPQFLNAFLVVTGLRQEVARVSQVPEPVKALHASLIQADDVEWTRGEGGKYSTGDLVGYLHALIGNLDCLLIYGQYLNDLIVQARQGDLEALFKAIRIDPSVVTTALARNLICISVIAGDNAFIEEVRKAMAGKTGKQARYLQRFRFLVQVLREADALGLPTKQIEALMLDLKAYEDLPGASKNLSELIRKAKRLKQSAISK